MPISYKNKIYTTLGTPTVASGSGAFVTNSVGVPAKDYTVKGKSIVWNQMVENPDFSNTTVDTRAYVSFRVQQLASPYETFFEQELEEPGLVDAVFTTPVSGGCRIKHNGSQYDIDFYLFDSVKDHKYYICFNFTSTNPTVAGGIAYDKAQLFDLTKMFGAGNEPATAAQFRAMFPDDYYPYNAGELKSIAPTSVEASGVERFQMLDKSKYPATTTINGVTFTNNGDGTITANGTATANAIFAPIGSKNPMSIVSGHKFLFISCPYGGNLSTYWSDLKKVPEDESFYDTGNGVVAATTSTTTGLRFNIRVISGYTANNLVFKPQLFDLTQMFGAGNEPATVAEFWQRVPEKFYGYNPNDYKSANIPSSKYFPDGMKSAGSVYDEINFLSQKAIKRIGSVDLGTLNWIYDGTGDNRYFKTIGISDIKKISDSSEMPGLLNAIYPVFSQGNWYLNKPCMFKIQGNTPAFCIGDPAYTDAAAFKAAMSGVMLYYELATPVETAITPPLQVLQTFKGFTSFSAPNSLTQNGPLSVTYYAEGGTNPEKGWLTSYKRKLYMGRDIEWNQLLDKSKFLSPVTIDGITVRNNGDGTFTINGTKEEGGGTSWFRFYNSTESVPLTKKLYGHKILYGCVQNPSSGSTNNVWGISYEINTNMSNGAFTRSNLGESAVITTLDKVAASDVTSAGFYFYFRQSSSGPSVYKDVVVRPQLFDLTQMFGAGNEPSTPEEFWSYFDYKLYPYNPGETQPLFKISRKSQGGGYIPKHYTARWDKVNAKMVRLNDAASFPTDVTNFAHRGSINASYSNPFDSIYPWSGIRICNIDLDAYMALQPGDSVTKCVKAWEGDPDFSYTDENGVWRYRPEFWGKSWDDGTYRYFDVTDKPAGGYVHYPESIGGRWHGRAVSKTINGEPTTCLLPLTGIPAVRTPLRTLHTYAKNYGATLDSIYSIDADTLLFVVEYATMNSQSAIGNGVSNLYRQGNYQIAEAATNSTVVKVLASDALDYFVYGAIFDIGTNNGGNQIGTFYVVSTEADSDPTYLNVTLNAAVTVTTDNYWSVRGLTNQADASIGSKSGYIGTNGKCNAYYRGMVLYGNMLLYTLGIFGNSNDQHYWIATSDEQADEYDELDTSAHLDTGLVLPTTSGFIQTLGMLPRSGLLSIPPFCTAIGGNSTNPIGDAYSYASINSVLLTGGGSSYSQNNGVFYENYSHSVSTSNWNMSARPRLKSP